MGAPTAMRAALDALRASAATAQPERSVGKNAKASLLYDAKSAADIDRETLHAIGTSGFEELCRRDGRFEAHARGLFGRAVAEGKHRELEDAKESAATSARIGGYLKLLSGYFTEKAASKTLEYLIRRFKIHVYDVDAFIACAMPWHSTPEFVKACQVCQLENSKHFKWLAGVKETGAAPPRDALAVRCSKDKAFFTFCAESAAEMATAKVTSFFFRRVCFRREIPSSSLTHDD
jgi:U3 small nucleolar RNA-associated protein 10